jgi:hypothetical protein
MHATSTFTVSNWTPAPATEQVGDVPMIETGAPIGFAHMVKTFAGDIDGRSITWFVGCLNQETGEGTYTALEAVDASVHGRHGTFNIVHTASTHGSDRFDEHFAIVPGSGTGGLAGIRGAGSLVVEDDGTHRLQLDYELGS